MQTRVHLIVEGLVQGVGFRWFVSRTAKSLNLSGYVRNRDNGSVEIMATGEEGMLHELIKATRIGPRGARVVDVKVEWQSDPPEETKGVPAGFEIR